jgi:hypothetical protein
MPIIEPLRFDFLIFFLKTGGGSPTGFLLKTRVIYKSRLKGQERKQKGKNTRKHLAMILSKGSNSCLLAGLSWQTQT